MHHQYRLSPLQWNPGPARKNPTQILPAACGRFHAVILQEASDHAPPVSNLFSTCTGETDLAILLNKNTFEPDAAVIVIFEASACKDTWRMVALVVRGLLRRPSLSGTPTVTFCSVHIHNVVAKKRDASTDLLRRLHAPMVQHNVDFIGGDFNMSTFSTVGDVFTDSEFAAPGNSLLWGLSALDDSCRECTGFLIEPKRTKNGVLMLMAATNSTTLISYLGPATPRPSFPSFFTCAPPTSLRAVNKLSSGAWNEKQASMNAGGTAEDSHDLLVLSLRENMARVSFPWRSLTQRLSFSVQQAQTKPSLSPLKLSISSCSAVPRTHHWTPSL